MRKQEVTHTLLLVLAAFLWGITFAFQSMGAEYVGPFTYLALRSYLAVIFLIPVIAVADRIRVKKGLEDGKPKNEAQKKEYFLGGISCGVVLMGASVLQQAGIAYTTTAKTSFITALYVVIVPILSFLMGRKQEKKIWFCMVLSIIGLYFLCFSNGLEGIASGDVIVLLCAFAYAVQILIVAHFVPHIDGIRLCQMQMFWTAILSTFIMVLVEKPTMEAIARAGVSIAFAGIVSSGIAYTLQIVGQEGLNPSVASLAMCLESVFGALGGWVILGEKMAPKEIFGACLMFAAIVLSQISLPKKEQVENVG
ncbi:MAG: DMT family transporter [Lachnospiraceae bacterium]|nr:DMT family transporter [Lachnospiraceae bacterium]